jgi:hypothetical protein
MYFTAVSLLVITEGNPVMTTTTKRNPNYQMISTELSVPGRLSTSVANFTYVK